MYIKIINYNLCKNNKFMCSKKESSKRLLSNEKVK